MSGRAELPSWAHWKSRPFPDANLLLLSGRRPALVDTGFVGHAGLTRDWALAQAGGRIEVVVNTHWHADHVGGNAAMQEHGAEIMASSHDAEAVQRRHPGCCLAEYLDQPVAPYSVDRGVGDGDILLLGETEWQVIATPGHTPGHLSLWQPDEQVLVAGDVLSDYDVGWVASALDGPDAATVAVASIEKLDALHPRLLLTAHGPLPADAPAVLATAHRRASRLVEDPEGAVWYAARRIFAYALMIHGGLPVKEVPGYLLARAWLADSAKQLNRSAVDVAAELVEAMRRSGAVTEQDQTLIANARHTPVPSHSLKQPWPRMWPPVKKAAR